MPFSSTISRPPNSPLQIRLTPGSRRSHRGKELLPSTSYMLNRHDALRHLQRQHHWHDLVTDRQRADVGRLVRKGNTYGAKFLREWWVWEDDGCVESARGVLEGDVVHALEGARGCETTDDANVACVLDLAGEGPAEEAAANTYYLGALLSGARLDAVREAMSEKSVMQLPASPATTRLMVALDKLQAFTSSTSIMKRMPMVQNPPGTKQRREQEGGEHQPPN